MRAIGPAAGTPDARLWWTLRTTEFTRERVEHIIATILNWRQEFPYALFKCYKHRHPHRTRAYWYGIRQLLTRFGGTKPRRKDEPGDLSGCRFSVRNLATAGGDAATVLAEALGCGGRRRRRRRR